MLRDLKALNYYFLLDFRYAFFVFWSIMVATLCGFLFLSSILEGTSIIVFTGPIVFIFCMISGLNFTKETFPFCIKMSMTRTRYVVGAFSFIVLLSITMAVMNLVIRSSFSWLLHTLNNDSLLHYSLLELLNVSQTWYNEILMLGLLNFVFLVIGFLTGTVFYRFGIVGGFGSVALLLVLLSLPMTREFLFEEIIQMDGAKITLPLLFIAVIILGSSLLNWVLLSKASTTPARTR